MRKSPLKSKSELKRTKPLKEGKPLKKKNVRRASERFTEAFGCGGRKAEFVRARPCIVFAWSDRPQNKRDGCTGNIEAAHTRSRGSGGDSTHLIPLCTAHHHEQHTRGVETFAAKYGLELEKLAAKYESDWQLWQSTNNKEGDK
jgi:hypothetical protein